jgi:hypothetical protein
MPVNGEQQALMDLSLQAYLLALGSGMRAYGRCLELYGEHCVRLASTRDQGAWLDDLRAWSRQVADVQTQESRLLVQQIEELCQRFGAAGEPAAATWKRWKVKA